MTDITPTESPLRIAALGLGAMGSGMARNLAAAGHDLVLWNRTAATADELAAELGATTADTPAAAAGGADVVLAMVRDDDASHAVWLGPDGAADALGPEAVAIDASTITPAWAIELGHALADRSRAFVEAPVVGSRPQVAAGALVSLVGGDPDAVERARGVLDVNSAVVRHCGAVGSAAVTKLAVNGLFAAQVAAFAEHVGFLVAHGQDLADTTSFLSGLPITSPGLQRILGLIADADYAPNFPVELVAKDLGYLTSTAAADAIVMPIADAAAETFSVAVTEGHGALDIAGVAARYV